MQCKEINWDNINSEFFCKKNIIYGAGYNGKLLYGIFKEKLIPIEAFYDDDSTRWGEYFCGKMILSKELLNNYDRTDTNIIIASMYVGQIIAQIQGLGFLNIYSTIEKLLEKDTEDFKFYNYQNRQDYLNDLDKLIDVSEDDKTKQYFLTIKKTVLKGKAIKDIINVCCDEKQYFLNCFKGKLNGINLLDAGAYTGDTVREILRDIQGGGIEKVYSFEADSHNYEKLQRYIAKQGKKYLFSENYALWDVHTKLGMKFSNYNARVDLNSQETVVETITIDEYFKEISLGFIKMDIEGAERRALQGGMRTIKRDRPILAISIYHSLDDIVEIPKMLMKELDNYKFIVRHHSYTYSSHSAWGA